MQETKVLVASTHTVKIRDHFKNNWSSYCIDYYKNWKHPIFYSILQFTPT